MKELGRDAPRKTRPDQTSEPLASANAAIAIGSVKYECLTNVTYGDKHLYADAAYGW
ncbi:hypothetical protein D3C85_1435610 [compost metagenome]